MNSNGDIPHITPRDIRIKRQELTLWADHYGTLAQQARTNYDYKAAKKFQELADHATRDLAALAEAEVNA